MSLLDALAPRRVVRAHPAVLHAHAWAARKEEEEARGEARGGVRPQCPPAIGSMGGLHGRAPQDCGVQPKRIRATAEERQGSKRCGEWPEVRGRCAWCAVGVDERPPILCECVPCTEPFVLWWWRAYERYVGPIDRDAHGLIDRPGVLCMCEILCVRFGDARL